MIGVKVDMNYVSCIIPIGISQLLTLVSHKKATPEDGVKRAS